MRMKKFCVGTDATLLAALFATLGFTAPACAQALTLNQALGLTYENNPQLNAQRAALRAVDEDVAKALGGWRPTIAATGSYGFERDELNRLPGQSSATPRAASVTVTQPIFNGQILANVAKAKALARAGRAQLTVVEQQVLFNAVLADMDVQEVTLARELEYLKLYLSIEQLRFSDRLRVVFDVDPDLLDAAVPHMALQPLVENSIRHGVGQLARPGVIAIRAIRVGDALHVVVQDDGPGFDAQGAGGGLKLGLANTRARLKQLYGDASELRTETAPGGGALVTMVLPFHIVEEPVVNPT